MTLKFFDPNMLDAFDCLDKNDGLQLSQILIEGSKIFAESGTQVQEFIDEVKWLLSEYFVESDMSFIYIDRLNTLKFVYRDFYGKRSLILHLKQNELLISSVCMVQASENEQDLSTFEMPANSLLVISDASIDLIEFDVKPS